MANYQGPHAAVTQRFVVSPGAVAVESLPSAAVATAYDVYQQESIASYYGIGEDTVVPWGTDNKVVYDKDVAGLKAFEMFPPKAYANTRYGNIDLAVTHDGFTEVGVALGRDSSYVVPGTAKAAGACLGIIPYYKADLISVILPADLQTVLINGGDVVTAQLKPGQNVFIYNGAYKLVGTVGSIGVDKTKILLSTPYSDPLGINGTKILVGAAVGSNGINPVNENRPNILFDPSADFVTAKVAIGDIINLSSIAISGSIGTPKLASVTAILNKNTLRFNTEEPEEGHVDVNFSKYEPQTEVGAFTIGSTIQLYSYSVNRLLGFGQSYNLKSIYSEDVGTTSTTTGAPAARGVKILEIVSPTMFKVLKTEFKNTYPVADPIVLNKGDVFAVNENVTDPTWEERDAHTGVMRFYKIDTITFVDTGDSLTDYYAITTTEPIFRSNSTPEVAASVGDKIDAWKIMIETDVTADFRAIRAQEHGVIKRIGSVQDIFDAWVRPEETTIDPRNELAFMANIVFSRSGGKVMYGVNVDSSANNLSAEYGEALEELKMYDVYSHCFGTTDAGFNGSVGAYCDEQSAPYEAHERIGIVCYDTDDLTLMGSDGCIADGTTGLVTVDGALNLLTAGVTVKDEVKFYDVNGLFVTSATVVESPTSATEVVTDYRGSNIDATHSARFESGRKDDQAVRIGSIDYGNRRVTQIFPGWFYAVFDGTRMILPPYFISAALAGMDSGVIVSQPLTNTPFSIPGLSNIELNTSTYFRKAQLDEIGGSGVDIMIQDTRISQTIKSRHDLTTNMDAIQFRERSITKQADVCAKTLRAAVAPYVGRYNINDKNLFKFLGQICSVVCAKLIKENVIFNIAVTSIKRDEVIDDKLNFYVEATAYIAANYYDITMLVKTR